MNTTRRHFIRNTTGVLAGAALAPTLFAAEAKKMRPWKKAVMWNTLGYPGTILEKCRALKAAGFHGLEAESHMNQDEVVRAMEETGLKCASVCGKHHWGKPLSSPDEKLRTEGIEALKQTLRDAKRYGAPSILLVPGVARNGVTYEQAWERSIAGIKEALPLCEETGVKIAIENVWNEFLMKPQQAKDYLEAINSPWVAWHFDIGNHIRFGPSEEWVKVLGKRIVNLHFKEYSNELDANGKAKGFGVKFLEGSNHWPEIMAELDKVGYNGWAITEMPGAQTKDAASMKEFSSRLDRILAS
ncbi:MAG TPA: sugar phosphate isomerase/epimerase family protein [Candidatus Acidoferrum sp.]|nr:sugar phosphate isomerase/epimerase family protein [Candidatus Acidoferrum sp.]